MAKKFVPNWAVEQVEYTMALAQFRHQSMLRRLDVGFVTTLQVAVLSIIGSNVLTMEAVDMALSVIAAFIVFMGLNNDWRMSAYMTGYLTRAREIEANHSMKLLQSGRDVVESRRRLQRNATVFPMYYILLEVVWVVVWIMNVVNGMM